MIPGSHRYSENHLVDRELKIWNGVNDRLFKSKLFSGRLPQGLLTAKKKFLAPRAGDAVIFHSKLLHTATYCWSPTYKLFLTYGVDDAYSQRYLDFFKDFGDRVEKETGLSPPQSVNV